MSVRHVHAKRGQYIRVHRDYGGSGYFSTFLGIIILIMLVKSCG